MGWFLVLGLKEDLLECARCTLKVRSYYSMYLHVIYPVGQAVEEKCQKLPSSNEFRDSDNQIIIEGRVSAVNLLPPFLAI
jgi:hypothetical protein